MFLFSKVKALLGVMVFSLFMAGYSFAFCLFDSWWNLVFVALQLVGFGLAFWSMSKRLSVQVARTSEIICAEQQAKLIVSMFDSGNLLDPDFVPVVELSRKVLEDLEEVRRG